jgi:hypothetical protein
MFVDALCQVSDSQVTGAAAVSTNAYDLGNYTPKRQIGTGEPVGFGIGVELAPTGVSLQVEVISATDAALTTGILSHGSRTILAADAPVGSLHYIGVAMGAQPNRYLGLRYTVPAGTATVSAWFTPQNMMSVPPQSYARNYAI